MYLKKHYDPSSLKADAPKVTHVDVLRFTKVWKPSTKVVEQGLMSGWLRVEAGKLILVTADNLDNLEYHIVAPPGLYCCHCGEKLTDSVSAQGHVKTEHDGEPSPDASNPAGYARHNFYLCDLEGD